MQLRVKPIWAMVAIVVGGAALALACGGTGGGGLGTLGGTATLGASCDVGASINSPSVVAANPDASECVSKICLLPAQERSTPTAPFCTATCRSDNDCAKGQQRGSAPGDRRCQSGFVCRTLLPKLENNPLSCQALCVCRDFLSSNNSSAPPPSCQ